MWLTTPIGFYSIVQKDKDKKDGMLTIRARVESDLNALRQFLPKMGKIVISANADYRYRGRVSKAEFSEALGKIAANIDYDNFKGEVMKVQGIARARLYSRVWAVLSELQIQIGTNNF